MTRQLLKAISTLAVVLLASTQAWAGSPRLSAYLPRLDAPAETTSCEDPKAQFAAAAAAGGYPINTEETVMLSHQDITLVVSSIAGYEHVPSSGFIEGADMGFMYLDDPTSEIPTGYYRLNAQAAADAIQVGEYTGTVRLIDVDGQTVASLPANFQTSSLDVPAELPFPRTTASAYVSRGPRSTIVWTEVIFDCPNGSRTIFRIPHFVSDF
jgi:hypothetical protein